MLKEYFIGLLWLVAFISLALGVVHPKLKSATGFCAGILLICSIMLPIVDIFKDFDSDYYINELIEDVEYNAYTDDMVELAFESGISKYVADKYGVEENDVYVMADGFDIESMTATRIYVTLSARAALIDYKKVEEDIKNNFTNGGECEVSLKIG